MSEGAEAGWVVVVVYSAVGLLYWYPWAWSSEPNEAIRFAREADAQRVAKCFEGIGARAEKHMWCP